MKEYNWHEGDVLVLEAKDQSVIPSNSPLKGNNLNDFQKATSLSELLKLMRNGKTEACSHCSRRPQEKTNSMIFGESCSDHQYTNDQLRPIVWVLRDPSSSKTAASRSGRLCMVCNDDNTARNARTLVAHFGIIGRNTINGMSWFRSLDKMGISRLRHIYSTNVVMHGKLGNPQPTLGDMRACRPLFWRQIEILKPRAMFVFGKDAADSVAQLEELSKLSGMKYNELLSRSQEETLLFKDDIRIYFLPHFSERGISTNGGFAKVSEMWRNISKRPEFINLFDD